MGIRVLLMAKTRTLHQTNSHTQGSVGARNIKELSRAKDKGGKGRAGPEKPPFSLSNHKFLRLGHRGGPVGVGHRKGGAQHLVLVICVLHI